MIRLGNHNRVKHMICLFGALVMILALLACSRTADEPVAPTGIPTQEITQAATPTATPTVTQSPEAEMPYKGDGSKYVYFTTNERDREWEEDIVYFADHFLNPDYGHPKLIERGCEICYLKDSVKGYDDWENKYESLYDSELRDEFIKRINVLLLSISEKSESELRLGCAEAAAIIDDGHTSVWVFSEKDKVSFYPLKVTPIYTDGVLEAYINAAPEGMEDLLLCRLDAINGVSFTEIIDRASRIISHENVTHLQNNMVSAYYSVSMADIVFCNEILHYLGVLDETGTARFSLTDVTGAAREVELLCHRQDEMPDLIEYQAQARTDESIGTDIIFSNEEESVWSRLLDNERVLYIRLNECSSDADKKIEEAIWAAQKTVAVQKVILDFRSNSGGSNTTETRIAKALDSFDMSVGKYVLIDMGSYSASVGITTYLRHYCKDALLVGTPAGMPSNGCFSAEVLDIPNKHIYVQKAVRRCFYYWPEKDDPVLMPDITVYQTLEDYKNKS